MLTFMSSVRGKIKGSLSTTKALRVYVSLQNPTTKTYYSDTGKTLTSRLNAKKCVECFRLKKLQLFIDCYVELMTANTQSSRR